MRKPKDYRPFVLSPVISTDPDEPNKTRKIYDLPGQARMFETVEDSRGLQATLFEINSPSGRKEE